MLTKILFRTIKKSLGRYIAILSIIALGVGFFAGLRVTEDTMKATVDDYLKELNLYDYKLISTLGFTEEDVQSFAERYGSDVVSGSVSFDFISGKKGGSEAVYHAHMLLDNMNGVDLVAGRLPEAPNECVVDALGAGEGMIGSELLLSENNTTERLEVFSFDSYKVVGLVNSSEYINFNRGNTALAGGRVAGFVYMPAEAFNSEVFTEIYLSFPKEFEIYSEAYENSLKNRKDGIEDLLKERADSRYESIYNEAFNKIADAEAKLSEAKSEIENGEKLLEEKKQELADAESKLSELSTSPFLPPEVNAAIEAKLIEGQKQLEEGKAEIEKAEKELEESKIEIADGEAEVLEAKNKLSELSEPSTFVLDRNTNFGYMAFKNDIGIVSGVAKVFPLFFFFVAALVCITTMTRMVGEGRSENGTLKALGYSNMKIASRYLNYAGSASVLGCVSGFLLGSKFMPVVLWQVYHIMYSVNREAKFVFDLKLFVIISLVYLVCIVGITFGVCRADLKTPAAGLMRPLAPTAGKRIFLERIGFVWKRMKFLHKVTARNIFRYKKRMIMMIFGIGGCTALLLAGLGIRDTIQPILDYQYNEINLFDGSVAFLEDLSEEEQESFLEKAGKYTTGIAFVHSENMDAFGEEKSMSAEVIAFEGSLDGFVDFHLKNESIAAPGFNEAVINYDLANTLKVRVGDELVLRNNDYRELKLKVSGIYENYIGEIVYITSETFERGFGEKPGINSAYLIFDETADEHKAAAEILGIDGVMSVGIISEHRKTVANMLESLDLIVLIVLVCAGALSFIVLFNLTNITITERLREIATLKVLGFNRREQNSYIFRENIILTAISALFGIPLGLALLNYVMSQIKIEGFYFGCKLAPISYLYGLCITMLFTFIVDATLTGKLKRINMAEAMKAIE